VLVELNVVEQRLKAVLEVLDGATVVDVARRYLVGRQTVHEWLRRYGADGLKGLVDHSSRPVSCPHQIAPEVEARIVELRRAEPLLGPDTILNRLRREGVDPLPGRSSVYRCLIRHNLVIPEARKRRREDYKRWERSRSMELWQMDIVGGVMLAGGGEAKIVSGIDDHSRFIISAHVVPRATARPTCDGLEKAMRTYGVPEQILTDNGKVFTGRFGPGTGEVLFDRICRENGVKHLLTAPRSPTTTGKIERWHKTLRREFLDGKVFDTIADAQARLDVWVASYNEVREHQSIGNVPPIRRFELRTITADSPRREPLHADPAGAMPAGATRRVSRQGSVSFGAASYFVARHLAGEEVVLVIDRKLVQVHHRGVLVATHARRHAPAKQAAAMTRQTVPKAKPAVSSRPMATVASVTRKVDSSGKVCFAGHNYNVGKKYVRRQIQVSVVGDVLEFAVGDHLIKTQPIRHDITRQHGALANPGGRAARSNAA
jgi:transposase InsO family protein